VRRCRVLRGEKRGGAGERLGRTGVKNMLEEGNMSAKEYLQKLRRAKTRAGAIRLVLQNNTRAV